MTACRSLSSQNGNNQKLFDRLSNYEHYCAVKLGGKQAHRISHAAQQHSCAIRNLRVE